MNEVFLVRRFLSLIIINVHKYLGHRGQQYRGCETHKNKNADDNDKCARNKFTKTSFV